MSDEDHETFLQLMANFSSMPSVGSACLDSLLSTVRKAETSESGSNEEQCELDKLSSKRVGNNLSKQETSFHEDKEHFLAGLYKSKEEFLKEYKKLCNEKGKANLFFLVLNGLLKAIAANDVISLRKINKIVNYIKDIEDLVTLRDLYFNDKNPMKNVNIIILACKYNYGNILDYLFSSNTIIILCSITGTTILPDAEDETCHNAFYYAIRSNNVELLDTLINKWPNNYFANNINILDNILSEAYEELKLKNVLLTEDIEIFVENKLIHIRFFSTASEEDRNAKRGSLNNINERIELVLQNISFLNEHHLSTEKFIFISKFIAQNIHVLKRQLKTTYDRVPWEEIEFCLVCYVASCIKQQAINFFYQVTFNKDKILNYLKHFAERLQEIKYVLKDLGDQDFIKLGTLPPLKREKNVAQIISNYPQFEELYKDYQQIRDIYSLEKISGYIKLALASDPKQREGQLIITRVLQVIGEYLKNTLESPKLSNTTSELLLLSLPKDTREVIIDLRNSLSHSYCLSKRTEIEENKNVKFFVGVQNDTKKIDGVITNILNGNKIKMMTILLNKIINIKTIDEIKYFADMFSDMHLPFRDIFAQESKGIQHDKLKMLIEKLSNNITDKTNYEKELFRRIIEIMNVKGKKSPNIGNDFLITYAFFKCLSITLNENELNHNFIRSVKYYACKTLENMPIQRESDNLKVITELSMKITKSVRSRSDDADFLEEIYRVGNEIFQIAEIETGDLKWIAELRDELNGKDSSIPILKQKETYKDIEKKGNTQLEQKLSELENILKNTLGDKLIKNLPSYKRNKKLQAVVEMLVLDIMSILGKSDKHLENNFLFLDDNTPLLTGKCLRNHLAHDNTLVDVLSSDPSIAVIINAKKLISENIIEEKRKVGKFMKDNPFELRAKLERSLSCISIQEKMFAILEQGQNLEELMNCLGNGADLYARNIYLRNALHYAVCGSNLEVVKFIIDQKLSINDKDVNGQKPLHVAAARGRDNIIEFLIRETSACVDDVDNNYKTPLHVAALNGNRKAVEILLKYNANTNSKDLNGSAPLHWAIKNNHRDVVEILLEKELDVNNNEVMGGCTSLHIAAEHGHLELVELLLRRKANVCAKNDRGGTPLHIAALNGHFEVVNALILKGGDVNSRVIDGCSPLHYAIENGHEEVVHILLRHGANVNVGDKTSNFTPLHYASKDGYENIVKVLLENRANVFVANGSGMTPLHFAVQNGHIQIVTAFLKHGVDIHARDMCNATPLHYAAESGNKAIAELLIKYGAKINDRDGVHNTVLHVAALNGHKDLIELLVQHNADVRTKNIMGETPLHAAARNGSKYIIELLIEKKAVVDAKSIEGSTPLHVAALNGHKSAVEFLLKSKAESNNMSSSIYTPLHAAIFGGSQDIVNLLLENGAEVNVKEYPPLHLAIEFGNKEIVEALIANGADISTESNKSPLLYAIRHNHAEIVEVLIAHGADIEADGKSLSMAIFMGHRDIVNILLRNKINCNMKDHDNMTPLHWAAQKGYKYIVNDLITRGANIDDMSIANVTPLYLAASEGHEEVAEILILNKANVNFVTLEGTPLYVAALRGHVNVIDVLLRNGAHVNYKDSMNRTPIELAVANGHLHVVKMLLQYKNDINAKGYEGWTMLHIASQSGDLKIIEYLVEQGSDINAKNNSGLKPIHIAAREGHKAAVKFFISKGLSVNELGAGNQTLLHYATLQGQLKVVKYLIECSADVDAKDINGLTPMHVAANCGYTKIIEILLKNGAVYDSADKVNAKPLEITDSKDVINLLGPTESLFESVKRNNLSDMEKSIKAGAFINAKNAEGVTSLHYAAWKGYDKIVEILLQNKANPNAIGSKGCMPIHYAAKFSHLPIVKALLRKGAIFDAMSDTGKTPFDFAVDSRIINLFKLVTESFTKIKTNNGRIIKDLNKIKDIDTVKAVMGACNRENETLVIAALRSNFSKVEQLKEIWQGNVSAEIQTAVNLLCQGKYENALRILKTALERRRDILGSDNPGTLDIQKNIAKGLYKQGNYQEALNILEHICQKQKEMLGLNNKDTLDTRSNIALILHRQGKDDKALTIFQEVYNKQKEILESNHLDLLSTQFHMAMSLNELGRYEEALSLNRVVFENHKQTLGIYNPATISAQNNIAMVLASLGKDEESVIMYKEVLEKKKIILGINHADTLRTLQNIAALLGKQKKYQESLAAYREVLSYQKNALGPNHPETLNTQYNLGNVLFANGKCISALKVYNECLYQRKIIFGPNHPTVLDILQKVEIISLKLKHDGGNILETLQHLQEDINMAIRDGDIQTIQRLLAEGVYVNDADIDGRTPLHYAVNQGNVNIVKILLKNGANISQVTNKGNTPLHTATSKCHKEIVEIMLQHISRDKLTDFVNAKTTSSHTTALHVAAKGGYFEIAISLLKSGAIYNIQNKDGKTPIELCEDTKVAIFLKTIEGMFTDIKNGNIAVINKLKVVEADEFLAITNARNNQGNTLLQVAIANKHKTIAGSLIKILKVNEK